MDEDASHSNMYYRTLLVTYLFYVEAGGVFPLSSHVGDGL
ncbi:putative membrane protein [Candidatus Erwinia dacicola]|uniref:Membrane protein n=1 Tax=Candidatus Erwinia dacicola TaxID=252393 RepID=A0A328TSK4_9GAMM|nr:putative membrane protein [Candidatus Erwinia dacicola]